MNGISTINAPAGVARHCVIPREDFEQAWTAIKVADGVRERLLAQARVSGIRRQTQLYPAALSGTDRIRTPVAAKMALTIAGMAGGKAGSPSPVGSKSAWRKLHVDRRRHMRHARRLIGIEVALHHPALVDCAMLDLPAWISLLGLMDECPVLPAALTATLDGRTRSISATEFECISTRSQLGTVREFMARLPRLLHG